MTFGTCHFTQFTDPVSAIMSVRSGKVLSHENQGSTVVIAFVTICPRFVLDMCICALYADFCQLQGFLILSYAHAKRRCLRVYRETGVLRVLLSGNAGLHTPLAPISWTDLVSCYPGELAIARVLHTGFSGHCSWF